jgi:transposase
MLPYVQQVQVLAEHLPYSPTSNQAGRDLRPSKTQQKISGRLRSEKTTRDRYAIRGYASTAAKHGIAVFTAIRDALAGNPWMPPIPASA